jgi:hypothetical protein
MSWVVIAAITASVISFVGEVSFSSAEAAVRKKQRPLYVRVTPRSYLDAGKVVPVGSLSQYAVSNRYNAPMANSIDKGFGSYLLPDTIGGGRNPFGAF